MKKLKIQQRVFQPFITHKSPPHSKRTLFFERCNSSECFVLNECVCMSLLFVGFKGYCMAY